MRHVLRRTSPVGLLAALFGLWTALTPSLIPRTWWMNTINVAVATLFAYALGAGVGRLARWFASITRLRITAAPRAVVLMRRAGYTVLLMVSVWVWFWSVHQQQSISTNIGMTRQVWFAQTVGVLTGLVVFVLLLLAARLVGHGVRLLYTGVHHFVAQPLLSTLVVALSLLLLLWATNNVVVRTGANAVARQMAAVNESTAEGRVPPTSPLRSGSPDSLEPWDTLGRQGQAVVSDGPTAADISRVTGRPAMEPIRVYAGLSPDRDFVAEANGVLAELLRTHAFERKVLSIQFGTGSGWLEEWSVASVEYLTNGDCATASMQYSYLGSVGAFLLDRNSPREGSSALFRVIHDYWASLDPHHRPKLYVGGVSLGSYGGQAAFASAEQMSQEVDGAVWVGTPGFTPIWRSLTDSRRRGSPEITPVIDNGAVFRFLTNPSEIDHDHWGTPYGPWKGPRIAYVQHASDPVVWWSPSLIWAEPDWIRERAGDDVNPNISWTPWSTFWQVTADMAISVSTPGGHGHKYHQELTQVWAAVLDVDDQPVAAIQKAIPATMGAR